MSKLSAGTRFIFSTGLTLFLLTILVSCTSELVVTASPTFTPVLPTITPIPPSTTRPPTQAPANAKYSFEEELNGWVCQTFTNAMACIQVSQSSEKIKDGQFSLKLDMDLIGSDEHKSQGEAWVDMRNFAPLNEALPFTSIDLANRTITMWVYAPTGAIGDNSKPNGFQIFVKDINWKSSYGSWINVVENQWIQLSFPVTASVAESGYVDPGFDPSQIIAVGIKIGAGGGSKVTYQGPIYIDAVNW